MVLKKSKLMVIGSNKYGPFVALSKNGIIIELECKNNSNIINDNYCCNPKYSCKDNDDITHDNKFSTNDQTKKKKRNRSFGRKT